MRFICEWCHEKVPIREGRSPHAEVLGHLSSCPRRSTLTTDEQVAGLALHITSIIADGEEKRMREVS